MCLTGRAVCIDTSPCKTLAVHVWRILQGGPEGVSTMELLDSCIVSVTACTVRRLRCVCVEVSVCARRASKTGRRTARSAEALSDYPAPTVGVTCTPKPRYRPSALAQCVLTYRVFILQAGRKLSRKVRSVYAYSIDIQLLCIHSAYLTGRGTGV